MKTNRAFTQVRRSAWFITVLVAVGGQFFPPLGLIVPVIMIALMVMSLFKGRYWCGNFCPHGSFFDVLLLPFSRNKKIPPFFQSKAFISFFFIFFMFNLTRRLFSVFAANTSSINSIGLVFSTTYLVVLLAGGLLALVVSPRTWCQFCPMGRVQAIFYKLGQAARINTVQNSKLTIDVLDKCISCAKCARVCPMQLSPYTEINPVDGQFHDTRCIKCSTCVVNCPAKILQLRPVAEAVQKTIADEEIMVS